MKKFNIIALSLLAFFMLGTIVYASSQGVYVNYVLDLGEYAETPEINFAKSYNSTIKLTNNTRAVDAEMGLSISRKKWFNYTLETRRDIWVKDKDEVSYTYVTPSKDTYKGTIVFNANRNTAYASTMRRKTELY